MGKDVLVQELRNRFPEEQVNDACLQRYLFTRSWKVDDAEAMSRKSLQWRSDNLPISREEVQPIIDDGKVVMMGAGTGGHPVFSLCLAKLLSVDWSQEGLLEAHIRAAVFCTEEMVASMPEGVETWIAVVD